ncbi:MFS transporter [Occultella gossypii]|uniref:MFS transporter n=1 Tax=Occultella gossypii TaxID=2800820 RepID=A0ABS7S6S0_9MICO|nr:MFS transporter [Occultella gossypii]MBZ2196054.1 MFS transporter [Occultella gossypii]
MEQPAATRMSARDLGVLVVLCGAIFLEGSDVAMLNVALPAIRTDLGLTTTELSGVITAYVVGYGGFMLLGGRAADVFGRRRMFLTWLVVFLLFSGLGGFATEGWMLLLARFVTGIAAGFLTPAGISLITTSFAEGPARNRALIIYGAAGAAGFSLGLVAGGLLTAIGWRWVFFAPVLIAAVLLALAIPLLTEPPDGGRRGRLGVPAALTLTASMVLFAYGLTLLERVHEMGVQAVGTLLLATALLVVFAFGQRRAADPLIRPGLLRAPGLAAANVTALLFAGSFYGFQFLTTLYLQELRGWTALQTGLAMLLMALDVVLAPTLAPRLVQRFGVRRVIAGGLLAGLVAYTLFLRADLDWAYAAMVPTMVGIGFMFALVYGPLAIAATDGVAGSEQGVAGGLLNTSLQFGAALGISAATAVQVAALGAATGPEAGLDAIRTAIGVPIVFVLLGAVVITVGGRPHSGRRGDPHRSTGAVATSTSDELSAACLPREPDPSGPESAPAPAR